MKNNQNDVVIVTGSSGLIGRLLCDRLASNYEVIGFDRAGPPHPPPSADCITVDLQSDDSVRQAFDLVRSRYGERIVSVVHLAAFYDFSGKPSPLYDEITVRGTERILNQLRSFQVEQFLFSSTMLIYAPTRPGVKLDEFWPIRPKWAYPESKVKTEQVIRRYKSLFPIVLARIAGVYDDLCHSIPLANQIQRIYERKLISHFYPGDLASGQSFLHLSDLVDALVAAVNRRAKLPTESVFVLGESETVSYGELQNIFARLIHGEPWVTKRIPKKVAKAGALLQDSFIKPWMIDLADDHYEVDISNAKHALGWTPAHSLRSTIPKMISSLKADPAKWYVENDLKKNDREPAGHSA